MARQNAAWGNFTARGQAWDHFWLDAATIAGSALAGVAVNSGGTGAASLTHVVTAPAGFASGQYVVVALALNSSAGTLTPPSGFSALGSAVGQSNPKIYLYGGFFSDVGAGTWQWNTTSSIYDSWMSRSYSGVNGPLGTDAIDVTGVGTDGVAATSFDLTGVTTATANAMVVAAAASNSSAQRITENNVLTEVAEIFGTSIKNAEYDEGVQAVAGATGALNYTLNSSLAWAGVVVALRSSTGSPPATDDIFAYVGGGYYG